MKHAVRCFFCWLTGLHVDLPAGSGEGCGKIIQRFPKTDWEGTAFPQGVEMVSDVTVFKMITTQTAIIAIQLQNFIQLYVKSLEICICFIEFDTNWLHSSSNITNFQSERLWWLLKSTITTALTLLGCIGTVTADRATLNFPHSLLLSEYIIGLRNKVFSRTFAHNLAKNRRWNGVHITRPTHFGLCDWTKGVFVSRSAGFGSWLWLRPLLSPAQGNNAGF